MFSGITPFEKQIESSECYSGEVLDFKDLRAINFSVRQLFQNLVYSVGSFEDHAPQKHTRLFKSSWTFL